MEACGRPSLIKIQRDSATSPTQRLANMDDPMIVRRAGVVKHFGSFVLSHLPLTQPCKAGLPHRENHAEDNEYEDSIRRGEITTKTVQQGSDRERSDFGELFKTRSLMSAPRFKPSAHMRGRYPPLMGEVSGNSPRDVQREEKINQSDLK